MNAVIQHGLRHIQRRHTGLMLQLFQTDDEFMHAGPVICQWKDILQLFFHIVGVQYSVLSRCRYTLPTDGEDIGQRLHCYQEVAAEGTHVSDAFRAVLSRQIFGQERLAAAGAASRTAASVRRREGFVQVHMDHVKAHVAGTGDAHDRVQIGTVIIAQASCLVDDSRDLQNIRVKKSHCIGIGQHQSGGIFTDRCFQGFQIHTALIV